MLFFLQNFVNGLEKVYTFTPIKIRISMKKIYLLVLFIISSTQAQNYNQAAAGGTNPPQQVARKIVFNYDVAGNQIIREVVLSSSSSKTTQDTIPRYSDIPLDNSADIFSYSPNPVQDELYVKWQLTENKYIIELTIYSINGQKIKSYPNLSGKSEAILKFYDIPQGTYNIVLLYSDGNKNTIKIIKR